MSVAIRIILTGALLFVVWRNSHWSVALTLTMLALANEANVATIRLLGRK